jgi:large subunit ribosomal protein L4
MAQTTLYKQDASEAGKVELSDRVFAAKVNQTLLYQSVNSTLASRRRGTQSAKTRGEVSGGGIKPWKQKGTGRARQGSISAVQWKGGGVAFAPKPRDYIFKLPAKALKADLR